MPHAHGLTLFSDKPRPLLSFTLWTRALVVAIITALVLGAALFLAGEGQLPQGEQLGMLLTVSSCALLGIISCLGERWNMYEDRVERVRYGRFRTVLLFRELEFAGLSQPVALSPTQQTVTTLREALDGSTPPLFTLSLCGRTPSGSTRRLFLSARMFNYHREAAWALSHLLEHCPPQALRRGSGHGFRLLLIFIKWNLIILACQCFWAHVLPLLGVY